MQSGMDLHVIDGLRKRIKELEADIEQGSLDYCALQERDDSKHVLICRYREALKEVDEYLDNAPTVRTIVRRALGGDA